MSGYFYAVYPKTPPGVTIRPGEPGLRIGKANRGLEFLFYSYPELGLTSAKAWLAHLAATAAEVVDQAGRSWLADDFKCMAVRPPCEHGRGGLVEQAGGLLKRFAVANVAVAKRAAGRDTAREEGTLARLMCDGNPLNCVNRWPNDWVAFRDPEGRPFADSTQA